MEHGSVKAIGRAVRMSGATIGAPFSGGGRGAVVILLDGARVATAHGSGKAIEALMAPSPVAIVEVLASVSSVLFTTTSALDLFCFFVVFSSVFLFCNKVRKKSFNESAACRSPFKRPKLTLSS